MTDEERGKIMDQFNEVFYTEANLDREQQRLADLKNELEAEERELCEKEKQLLAKREKLLGRMTDAERSWERLSAELDELLYEPFGLITQLRDGYTGPFDVNEKVKTLCGKACRLIAEQGYADIAQFNYFILLMQELSSRIDDSTSDWLTDYLDELSDVIMVPEE